ncbi:IclR family transcriptional regulator [Roseomonas aeriglobus]|nr:IclR family transcriptional regulator [Roseomonas aeriglobus]
MGNPDDSNVKLVGAVVQAVKLLHALEVSDKPMGVSALARETKINPSTAFNILRTLVVEKLVNFDEPSKTYALGGGLLTLSRKLLGHSLVAEIRPELNRLATETSCLVGIWQATPDRMILIERAVSDQPMRLDMPVKQRLPIMMGAVGRAMAAYLKMTDPQLRAAFRKLRWEGPISADDYVEQVRTARETGYGIDRGTLYPGIVSIGVIISGGDGRPLYGLTASDFEARFDDDRIADVSARMTSLAKLFSI